jgi:divalent anion:Na+ symporter, DASS family
VVRKSLITEETSLKPNVKLKPLMIAILIGTVICFIPRPDSIPANGWYLLAVFIAVLTASALGAVSLGLASFIGIFVLTSTHIITTQTAFSSYSESLLWLIVCADCLSLGITKTGLGQRIAYNLIKRIGKKTIGAGYALVICEIILSMLIPSASSRAIGVVFPIAKSLSESYGSRVEDGTQKKAGAFLMLTGLHSNLISCSFFLTSSAVNLLAISMAKALGVTDSITFRTWFLVGIVPSLISFIVVPLIIYLICPPEVKQMDNVKEVMDEKLQQLGPLKVSEKVMIAIFSLVVALWIFGSKINLDSTTVAVLGLIIIVSTGVVSWKEFTGKSGTWDLFIWIGAFMMMAGQLNKLGVINWISVLVKQNIVGVSWWEALLIVCLVMYYLHYLFASNTVHFTALFSAFLAILLNVGAPPLLSVILLANISALSSGLTHYGVVQGSVYFAAGYVQQKKWWSVGLIVSIVHLIIWFGIGMLWWKVIGLY